MKSGTDDLRVAVIGLGVRAYLIQLAHRPAQGSRVVALCDVEARAMKQQRPALGAANQVFCAADYRRVLERAEIDAVLVLTPDHTHEASVIDALRAGKAVFGDAAKEVLLGARTVGHRTTGCDHIASTARATGARLYVGHNMRHFAVVKLLEQLIDQSAIGEPRAVWCRHFVGHGGDDCFKDWHAQRRHTHSLLLQKGAHDM